MVTGTDKAAAIKAAEDIALSYWNVREACAFGPVTGPLDDMLAIAAKAETRPVILADSADNPTGGGVGDRADVLNALLTHGGFAGALIAGITDRPAVESCFAAGKDARLSLSIGGTLDPASKPAKGEAEVLHLDDPGPAAERQAVVLIGGITVVLAARRRPYHNIPDFTRLGLDPHTVPLLVVKSGYLSPDLAPIANPNLMALTQGVVDQDIEGLVSNRRQRPAFPFDRDFAYTPQARLSARWQNR